MTGSLEVVLYLVAAWFTLAALGLGIFAVNRPGRGQKAALMVLSLSSLLVAIGQILAAGDLK